MQSFTVDLGMPSLDFVTPGAAEDVWAILEAKAVEQLDGRTAIVARTIQYPDPAKLADRYDPAAEVRLWLVVQPDP